MLAAGEVPPYAMLKYVADQIGADPTMFTSYARREETRHDHIARLMIYLGVRKRNRQDRRAGLLSAIESARGAEPELRDQLGAVQVGVPLEGGQASSRDQLLMLSASFTTAMTGSTVPSVGV
ncbi:hypothetical protein GCM10010869_21100 [Mesorhizobium tianshanense]|uniref:Uncharacterized protein DUF4158 n=1 Tax=Mesorhizobium tianshanense TaxID=39844 RepID=A0A562MQY5_9HYPH|nr:DUF4158 domain-containing protein [Mesorhizobium tianshanense]TWI22260.1 uncharacterized protein DUF4158 [Mesorhizobium tianshanense]GLS36521.1 hypothetical protein GCM10010869_21100 [Mesorhizobium tianshanense]